MSLLEAVHLSARRVFFEDFEVYSGNYQVRLKNSDTSEFFCFNKCLTHYQMLKKDYGQSIIETTEGPKKRPQMGGRGSFLRKISQN